MKRKRFRLSKNLSKKLAGLLVLVVAAFAAGCTGFSQGNPQPPPAAGQLVITPGTATITGGTTQQFSAQVVGDPAAPSVAWNVNGTAGGSAATGTISASGVYTAPEFPPTQNAITIGATVTTDATKTASSNVTLLNPVPAISSITPNAVSVGTFKLTINGAHFATNATVNFGSTALTTTRVSATQLTATGTATSSQIGNVAVTVKNPAPGDSTSAAVNEKVTAQSSISVSITPLNPTVPAGEAYQWFTPTVTGGADTTVTWTLNGDGAGNAVIGYMNGQGGYRSPDIVPTPNTITVTATSNADPSKSASTTITVVNPVPVITSLTPPSVAVGPFLLTINGTGFVKGATVSFGGQPLTTVFVSSTELSTTGTSTMAQVGSVAVTVTNPAPGNSTSVAMNEQVVNGNSVVTPAAAVRFLEQSSFGPTPETVNQVSQLGFDNYLQGQFGAPTSIYPDPAASDSGLGNVQKQFFLNSVNDSDQLRMRVAFALNELWVVSGNKVSDPTGYTNYVRALTKDAFGNYYDVMKDVTLTPAMGNYLDMVNNDKPANGQHANENYARELMQLFTLGLSQLNPDGTPVIDQSTGEPVPSYTQDDVMALGRSLTGWTYPTQSGATLQRHNPQFFGGPMVPFDSNHDGGQKTFLGQNISGGQSAAQELDSVLTVIFNHPNLPPFVSRQLIEKLVTSNPSPAYVQRVAAAFSSGKFNNYGGGKRGDLQATIAAILLDSEARRGDTAATADPNDGKLREPVVMVVSVARAFHAQTDGSGFTSAASNLSQNLFNPGSVFNFFPPDYLIPGTNLNGPEFAIFNTNTSLARVNFINTMVYGSISSTKIDMTPIINAGSPDQMIAALDTLFLHNTMSDSMKQTILTAMNAVNTTDTKNQARAAIYLVLSSSQYQVQR